MTLSAHHIGFGYRAGSSVLRDVCCEIQPGKITVLVGPNGAGKSTLLRLLAGVRAPGVGSITLDGRALKDMNADERALRIAYIAQRSSLAFDFNVRRVVAFGRFSAPGNEHAIDKALERFELRDLAGEMFATLSVGQQQRVSIARAWAQLHGLGSGYLLADEPCASMDPRFAAQTMNALRELSQRGVGVGVVLHDLSTACSIADRGIVLDENGRVHAQGGSEEALHEEILSDVFSIRMIRRGVEGVGIIVRPANL